MKRLLVSVLAWVMVTLGLACSTTPAYAMPGLSLGIPAFPLAEASGQLDKDLMTQLETEILPQLEAIFNPEQREQFKTSIANGTSFRKAFKSLVLTPEQKTQLKTLLKSASEKGAFTSLTPEQKKQLFMKKKEIFMPTSEEITDKVSAAMKDKGATLPEGVKEKIEAGMKKKDAFLPSAGDIGEKISAGVKAIQGKLEE